MATACGSVYTKLTRPFRLSSPTAAPRPKRAQGVTLGLLLCRLRRWRWRLRLFLRRLLAEGGDERKRVDGTCSSSGTFGSGGGASMADQYGVDLLGQLPLDIRIREEADSGKPTVVADSECRISMEYRTIARKTAAKLSLQAKDYAAKFPSIVIQNN